MRRRLEDRRKRFAMMPNLRIRDHRGRRTPLADPGSTDTAESITRSVRRLAYRPWMFALYALLGLLLSMCMSNFIALLLYPAWSHAARLAATSAALLFVIMLARHLLATIFVQIYLNHGCCPSCGYPLTNLPPQPDRCRICPECSSAWFLRDSV